MRRLLLILLFAAVASAQQVNPHSQISWPANCNAPGMVYNIATNTCTDISHVPPANVAWPASCATGTYVPATNTCVATGTASNPGGAAPQVQFNAGGTFQGVAGSSVDGSGNVKLPSTILANSPMSDIRAFGAVIDGVSDNTAAVAAAYAQACLTSGTVLLPCMGSGCYLKTGKLPTCAGYVGFKVQGTVTVGSTLIVSNNTPFICDGGYAVGSFTAQGPGCTLNAPQAHGTLGTTVVAGTATFSPTFTSPSTSADLPPVGSAITVIDNCTATITSVTRTAAATNNVSATYTPACRVPPGALITLAGITDSSFNGTAIVLTNDYPAQTITWAQVGTPATSSGGTFTGSNDDSFESCDITASSSGNLTCYFSHPHDASASWGEVGFQFTPKSFLGHYVKGLRVKNCYGACIRLANAVEVQMDGVAGYPFGWPSAIAFEASSSLGWHLSNATLATTSTRCNFTCAQPSYPMGMRITSISDPVVTDSSGFNVIIDSNTFINGGIKVDTNGNNAITSMNRVGGLHIMDTTIEQPTGFALLVDPRYININSGFTLDNVKLQDSFVNPPFCLLGNTDPNNLGFAAFNTIAAALLSGCTANKYWGAPVLVNGANYTIGTLGITQFLGSMGTWNDGKMFKGELSGSGANMSPSVVPYATAATNVAPATWTCAGVGCAVNTAQGPDGMPASAGEIVTGSGASPSVTVLTRTGTTAINDVILAGVWCMPGQNPLTSNGCWNLSSFGTYALSSNGSGEIFDSGTNRTTPIQYEMQLAMEPWQPLIGMHIISTAAAGSHNITMQLFGPGTTGKSAIYAKPFFMYIPYASKPATWTDDQWFKELARLRTSLLHGSVPASMPAGGGILAIDPIHKLYWGSDTNLYRAGASILKTDDTFDALNYKINGSFGSAGQFMQSTGTGTQWTSGSSTGAALAEWSSGGVKTAGVAISANVTQLWSFSLPGSSTSTKISFTPSTADNSANLYDIGIYAGDGSSLLCHVGATAGTIFAPSTSTITLSWLASCPLVGGIRYLLAITGTTATGILNTGGLTLLAVGRGLATSGGTTTGGALNNSLTPPADSWVSVFGFPQISLHN